MDMLVDSTAAVNLKNTRPPPLPAGIWKQLILFCFPCSMYMLSRSLLLAATSTLQEQLSSSTPPLKRSLENYPGKQSTPTLSAWDIVNRSYNQVFAQVTDCPDRVDIKACVNQTFTKNAQGSDVPWWFLTMLRDAPITAGRWHHLSAHNVTEDGRGLQMCAIEKIGTKHWRGVFCHLQDKKYVGNRVCREGRPIEKSAAKAVFLRDPLERFLSAYMDKCLDQLGVTERHCEPTLVFSDHENGLTEGLKNNKKMLFEAYVDAMPLKWNMHFFPQR